MSSWRRGEQESATCFLALLASICTYLFIPKPNKHQDDFCDDSVILTLHQAMSSASTSLNFILCGSNGTSTVPVLAPDGGPVVGSTAGAPSASSDVVGTSSFLELATCNNANANPTSSLYDILNQPGAWYKVVGTGGGFRLDICNTGDGTSDDPDPLHMFSANVYQANNPLEGEPFCYSSLQCVATVGSYLQYSPASCGAPGGASIQFGTADGAVYYIWVASMEYSSETEYSLILTELQGYAPNSVCENAVYLQPGADSFTGNLTNTTTGQVIAERCPLGDPLSSNVPPFGLWYAINGTGANLQLVPPACEGGQQIGNFAFEVYATLGESCDATTMQCVGVTHRISMDEICGSGWGSRLGYRFATISGNTYFVVIRTDYGTEFAMSLMETSSALPVNGSSHAVLLLLLSMLLPILWTKMK